MRPHKWTGANATNRLIHIIVPLMKPTILFALVLSTIGTVNIFTQVYILTNGGPQYSTTTPSLFLYDYAFQYGQFGYAAAAAMILFLITAFVSWGEFHVLRKGADGND